MSLELGHSVDIAFEGSIVDVGAVVVQVGHDWLVHRSVPLHVPWSSVPVSVHVLVVLVVHWVLSSGPLSASIWYWWVLWQNAGQSPLEEVWVVSQSLRVEGMVPQDQWAVVSQTTAAASDDVVDDPEVGKGGSGIEVLDWELTDGEESEDHAELGTAGVVSEVEVRLVDWTGNLEHLAAWEPAHDL